MMLSIVSIDVAQPSSMTQAWYLPSWTPLRLASWRAFSSMEQRTSTQGYRHGTARHFLAIKSDRLRTDVSIFLKALSGFARHGSMTQPIAPHHGQDAQLIASVFTAKMSNESQNMSNIVWFSIRPCWTIDNHGCRVQALIPIPRAHRTLFLILSLQTNSI